jgi:folate-binding protein YgfZ
MVDWNALDYSMAPPGYRELRTGEVRVELPGMAYFKVVGEDRLTWLQGQTTNDVLARADREWVDACLAKPTGQIEALLRVWSRDGHLIVATERPDPFRVRFEQTVMLEDVGLSRLAAGYECLQGPAVRTVEGALPSDRTGSGGREVPVAELPTVSPLSREAYFLATLEAGIPLLGFDVSDRTLPPELGPHFESQHVSYTKGCYVGQEVLMRIRARGHTNKTWVGLRAAERIPESVDVKQGGNTVGTVHRASVSPVFGHIASATLRNEATREGTIVRAGDVDSTVVQMPFLR